MGCVDAVYVSDFVGCVWYLLWVAVCWFVGLLVCWFVCLFVGVVFVFFCFCFLFFFGGESQHPMILFIGRGVGGWGRELVWVVGVGGRCWLSVWGVGVGGRCG